MVSSPTGFGRTKIVLAGEIFFAFVNDTQSARAARREQDFWGAIPITLDGEYVDNLENYCLFQRWSEYVDEN